MTRIESDADLAPLKTDPRFAALLPTPADFTNPFVEPVKIIREWDGEAAGDQFGWIARNIGDVDGDGVPDIVTSAPTSAKGGDKAGRIYVYSTRTGRLLWTADGAKGDQLGTGIEGAGDANKRRRAGRHRQRAGRRQGVRLFRQRRPRPADLHRRGQAGQLRRACVACRRRRPRRLRRRHRRRAGQQRRAARARDARMCIRGRTATSS